MRIIARSLIIFALAACASDKEPREPAADSGSEREVDAAASQTSPLELPMPKNGFQVRSIGADVMSGEDVEYCEVAELPGGPDDKYYVNTFEFANEMGSHHLIVNAAVPGSPAEAKVKEVGAGNRVPCLGIENKFGSDSFVGVGGTQTPYNKVSLPDRIGRVYTGGQLIVFDYHYLNTTEETIHAQSVASFHLTDASEIDHVARGFGFSNYLINTAPGTEAHFTGECRFRADVMLGEITRHTHRWSTDFTVWFAGGENDGQQIWSSDDWQHVTQHLFDKPVLMRAGEGLRFRCGYQNDTARRLRFGTSATDEMCILFGTFWETEKGQNLPSQSCSIVWEDDDGVGHPAHEAGGFPKPSAAETDACLGGSPDNPCARCRCDACAPEIIQCAGDSDCQAVNACYAQCGGGPECGAVCQDTLDTHSSAVGMLTQTSACTQSRCAEACSR